MRTATEASLSLLDSSEDWLTKPSATHELIEPSEEPEYAEGVRCKIKSLALDPSLLLLAADYHSQIRRSFFSTRFDIFIRIP